MGKFAVLVGINYHDNPKAALKGCVNDVKTMQALLQKKGFNAADIKMINDEDRGVAKPSGAEVKKALNWLCSNRTKDDTIFFHYSGHGVQIRDSTFSRDEADGKDEAIVLQHGFLLADDDLKQFFGMLPHGCHATVVMDCCHSGGILDGTSVAITGDKRHDDKSASRGVSEDELHPRSLPVTVLCEMLSSHLGGKQVTPDRKSINGGLAQLFGGDACKLAMQFAAAQMNGGRKSGGDPMAMLMTMGATALLGGGAGGSGGKKKKPFGKLAAALLGGRRKQQASNRRPQQQADKMDIGAILSMLGLGGVESATSSGAPPYQHPTSGNHKDTCVLITGCASDETSADVRPRRGKAHGALTAALEKQFEENHNTDNKDLVLGIRQKLLKKGTKQNPQLECTPANASLPFICKS